MDYLLHEHDLERRIDVMEGITGLEREQRLKKVKDVLDELPLPEYRRFKVVRKEIEQLERERDELQAVGPMQRNRHPSVWPSSRQHSPS